MANRRQLLVAGLGAILMCASLAAAQQIFVGGGRGFAKLKDFESSTSGSVSLSRRSRASGTT